MVKVVTVSVQGAAGLDAAARAALEEQADAVHLARAGTMGARDAARSLAGAAVVAVTPKVTPRFDAALLRRLPELRGIVVYATGTEPFDLRLLAARGIRVVNLADYCSASVAEHALGLLLALAHRIHLAHDRSRGIVPATVSLRGCELAGRTLGVVGLGRIGTRVAVSARGLGMQVVATDPRPRPAGGVPLLALHDLLDRSDAVTLHVPATFGAQPLIGAGELALLRPGAVLVNTSRAALVDTPAVVAALRARALRGYAVDDVVLGPRDADLLAEGRVLQTGHSAWWTDEALARGGQQWLRATAALARAQPARELAEAAS